MSSRPAILCEFTLLIVEKEGCPVDRFDTACLQLLPEEILKARYNYVIMEVGIQKRILVAGGSGYAGETISRYLRAQGHIVFSPPKSKLNYLDLEAIDTFVKQHKVSSLVMSVAKPFNSSMPLLQASEQATMNLKAEDNLIKIARKYKICDFIHLGSAAIFQGPTLTEEHSLENLVPPNSLYGRAKLQTMVKIEKELLDSRQTWVNLVAPGLCGFYVKNLSPYSYLLPGIIEKCRKKQRLQIDDTVAFEIREYISTLDLARLIHNLLTLRKSMVFPNRRLNMTAENSYNIKNIIEHVESLFYKYYKYEYPSRRECILEPYPPVTKSIISNRDLAFKRTGMNEMVYWQMKKITAESYFQKNLSWRNSNA